jgi:hypothetical protein
MRTAPHEGDDDMTVTPTKKLFACKPLDLSRYLNFDPREAGAVFEEAYVDDLLLLPSGPQEFRGITFQLASRNETRRWIAAGEPVTIDVHARATHVVFAHICPPVAGQVGGAEFDLWDGVGDALGRYVIVYEDGTEQELAVRRRFEVNEWVGGLTPTSFGSVTHGTFPAVDWRGPHARQTRPEWGLPGSSSMKALPGSWAVNQGGIGYDHGDRESTYWLYAATVLEPDVAIRAIRVEGVDGSSRLTGLLLGGVTCFSGSGDPFKYAPARTLLVDGPDIGVDSPVLVDLGVCGLPRRRSSPIDRDLWLREPFQGWGDTTDAAEASGILLEVASTPDASLSVGELKLPLRAMAENDVVEADKYRIEVIPPSDRRVQVTIIDALTGLPTPARVHVHAADGRYLPPEGHRDEINLALMEDYGADLQMGGVNYAYVDGTFDIALPLGDTFWEVVRGFETTPLRREVRVEHETSELRFELDRWIDMRSDGWVSADTHVHFVPPPTAMLEARAEDVNLVHVLATQWGYLFSSIGDFPAGTTIQSEHETGVWVGQEQRQPVLGHMSLLSPGSLIFPIGHGGEPTSPIGSSVSVLMADWADRCREQGGLVVSPHFPFPYGEIVADVVMEKIDAIEIFGLTSDPEGPRVRDYYRLLNCGYRVPLVGGTDKMSAGTPIGAVRTYAQLAEGDTFGFESWADAVRAGRTFQTSGPLLQLRIEGQGPGSVLSLPPDGGSVSVEATAAAAHQLDRLEIVVNGAPVVSAAASGSREIRISETIAIDGTSWVAARCTTPYSMRTAFPTAVGAHTSPVYVQCGDRQQIDVSDAKTLLALIDGGRAWVENLAVAHESDRGRLAAYFHDAHMRLAHRLAD